MTANSVVIVVPCFNEAERLAARQFLDLARSDEGVEFLFVDDGSTDDTKAILQQLVRDAPRSCGMLSLARNVGKAEAVRLGLLETLRTSAPLVGYWDADLSTPLDEISRFRQVFATDPSLVAVMGSRVRRLGATIQRRPLRHYAGRVFATAASAALGLAVYDTQCGAKLLRVGPELRAALDEPFRSRWVLDVEILARLGVGAERLYELPLRRWSDVAGSKLRYRHALVAAIDLFSIWRDRRRP